MISVLFVCLGNICRSPMAEGVFRHLLRERGLEGRFHVDSAGTGSWHVGEPPDPRTLAVLRDRGIALDRVARQLKLDDAERFDWILTMDESNLATVRRMLPAPHHHKVHPVMEGDVPDPYYGGAEGFAEVYALLHPVLDRWIDRMLDGS